MKNFFSLSIFIVLFTPNIYSQNLEIPSSWGTSQFEKGTGDEANFTTYNSFLNLHMGLAIGSPFTDNGSGGYIKKATIVFNGRTGNIASIGNIVSHTMSANTISASLVSSPLLTATSKLFFPTFNNYTSNYFAEGTGDGASLATYNTILKLHSGLAIGSPFVSDGKGGYIDKAVIVFDGRTGNIISQGLIVSNKIHSSEVLVDLNVPGPDYVFEENYDLPSLDYVDNYIKVNKHLPEIASAKEMKENGINVSEMNMSLLKKIEELTLYTIQQNKEIQELKKENNTFKTFSKRLTILENQSK